jgi:ribulose-5-phosphate 4-epimerase/fuculose-1-phosphate aldolase
MMSQDTILRDKLATCTRILAMQELMGLFGHISVFDPDRERVYFSPGMGADKADVGADHILASNLAGDVLTGDQRLPAEWPIHTVLHRRRGDAIAVAHLHSPYATLFSMSERKFRPVTLQGSIFDQEIPIYQDPRLVRSVGQGEALADGIGDRAAIFMRGHGVVIVARDIEEMLFAALILEDEARKAVDLAALGHFHCLDHHDCQAFGGREDLAGRSKRAWGYYEKLEKRWDRNPGTGRVPFV